MRLYVSRLLLALLFLTGLTQSAVAAPVVVMFTGEVGCGPVACTIIDDPNNLLGQSIFEGAAISGFFVLPEALPPSADPTWVVRSDFDLPIFIAIGDHTWQALRHLFTIMDDDPQNGWDRYASEVQAEALSSSTVARSWTGGFQLFDNNRVLPISTDPLNPPDPFSFNNARRIQIFGDVFGDPSAEYLISGHLLTLSAIEVPEPSASLAIPSGAAMLLALSKLRGVSLIH